MQEEWREVKDYPNYEVSNLGRVRNKSGRVLASNIRNGYYGIGIFQDGIRKYYAIHQIVFKSFFGEYNNKLVINHIDGNPLNNFINNLELISQANNIKHYTLCKKNLLNKDKVLKILELYEQGVSIKTLAGKFLVHKNTISSVLNGRRWSHVIALGLSNKEIKQETQINERIVQDIRRCKYYNTVMDYTPVPKMENEDFRYIENYVGLYLISNIGRIFSLRRNKFIKGYVNASGYVKVCLHKNGSLKCYNVHMLVADSFIGKLSCGYVVHHVDGCKTNNIAENLKYVTYSENVLQAVKCGAIGKLSPVDVLEIIRLYNTGKFTQECLADRYGVGRASIINIMSGKTWNIVTGIIYQKKVKYQNKKHREK